MKIVQQAALIFLFILLCACVQSKKGPLGSITKMGSSPERSIAQIENRSFNPEIIKEFFDRNHLQFDDHKQMGPELPQVNENTKIEERYDRNVKTSPLSLDSYVQDWIYGQKNRSNFLDGVSSAIKTEKGHYILVANRVYFKRASGADVVFVSPFSDERIMSNPNNIFNIWTGGYEFYGDDTFPAAPNCSEQDVSIEELLKIYERDNIKTSYDFLKAIPKNSLQKFTFIKESESLQRDGVNKNSPRVLRFSTDGKISLTYTCDPSKPEFNTVEIISFDERERRYNFFHLSFPLSSQPLSKLYNRTHKRKTKNHLSCLGCHGGYDPRPNWSDYDQWAGVHGSDDDRIGHKNKDNHWTADSTRINFRREGADYVELRKKMAFDPCFQSLTWPSRASSSHMHYPYIGTAKEANYNFRPNAHYTIIQSRRNAQRLARKFQSDANWDTIKYDILLETLNCKKHFDIPNDLHIYLDMTKQDHFYSDPYSIGFNSNTDFSISYPEYRLPKISAALGFYSSDWTLFFNKGGPKEQERDPYATAQWHMEEFVLSVLFRDMADEIDGLKKYDLRVNRMTQQFGRNFMCVDEVADKLWLTNVEREQSCKLISAQKEKVIKTTPKRIIVKVGNRQTRDGGLQPSDITSKDIDAKVGEKILSTRCTICHDGKVLKYDFSSDQKMHLQTQAIGFVAYRERIVEMLGHKDSCEMPYSMMGSCLSDAERESVLKYVDSFK